MENYVYNFFFEVREYYTFPSRVRAPDHEYGGPLSGDLPVRSCVASKVPVENVWAKYTSKTSSSKPGRIIYEKIRLGENYRSPNSIKAWKRKANKLLTKY